MPSYRSAAEAEVRDAVVARLRQLRPDARIMHEINACSFGNRIDVLAVSQAEIIAVEVKSERDKLDRLSDQIEAMSGCAHHVIAALHDKFWIGADKIPERSLRADWRHLPTEADRAVSRSGVTVWRYPEVGGGDYGPFHSRWVEPRLTITTALPPDAIHMLWANELREMCADLGIAVPRKAVMPMCINALNWSATGAQITRGICAALRRRASVEADPPRVDGVEK